MRERSGRVRCSGNNQWSTIAAGVCRNRAVCTVDRVDAGARGVEGIGGRAEGFSGRLVSVC